MVCCSDCAKALRHRSISIDVCWSPLDASPRIWIVAELIEAAFGSVSSLIACGAGINCNESSEIDGEQTKI